MSLQLQMIGTGSAFAKRYYNNNALLTCGNFKLLIDCGFTASKAMYDLSIPYNQIDAVLVTHIHADHIGGLEELAFQLTYLYNRRRIKLLVPSSIKDELWNHSLKGGLENVPEGFTSLEDYFEVVELEAERPFAITNDLKLELLSAKHIPDKHCYSVYINDSLFYSSDTTFNPELLNQLVEQRGCRVLLHDCQLAAPGVVHVCLDELLTLPEHIQERVYLMHYGDNMPSFIGKTGSMQFIEQAKIYDF